MLGYFLIWNKSPKLVAVLARDGHGKSTSYLAARLGAAPLGLEALNISAHPQVNVHSFAGVLYVTNSEKPLV
jgi:hypothetical protein